MSHGAPWGCPEFQSAASVGHTRSNAGPRGQPAGVAGELSKATVPNNFGTASDRLLHTGVERRRSQRADPLDPDAAPDQRAYQQARPLCWPRASTPCGWLSAGCARDGRCTTTPQSPSS